MTVPNMTAAGSSLEVDMITCDGRGVCADLLPEWIRLDDWGFPVIRPGAVPPEMMTKARWAIANCPVMALRLTPGCRP
jgi:ferredoxin